MRLSGKKNQFFYACMITGGLLMSCHSEAPPQKEDTVGGHFPPPAYKMYFHTVAGSTRASVNESSMDNGQTSQFRWDAADEVMIWTGSKAEQLMPCRFVTHEGGLNAARFEYEGEQADTQLYFGFYPYSEGIRYDRIQVRVPADGSIIQTQPDNSTHIGAYRPMYTSVISRTENTPELQGLRFRHITGLLYFRIRNGRQQPARIESITLRADRVLFHTQAVLQFTPEWPDSDPTLMISESADAPAVTLSLGEEKKGIEIAQGGILKAYLPVLPVKDLGGVRFELIVRAEGKDYAALAFRGEALGKLEAAHYYRVSATLTDKGVQIEPVIGGWEQGEDIDVPVR